MADHGRPKALDVRETLEYKIWHEDYGVEYAEAMRAHRLKKTKKQIPATKTKCKLEKTVVIEIKNALKGKVRTLWQNTTGGLIQGDRITTNPNVGIPDLMGITLDGRFFAFEVKSPEVKWPPRMACKYGVPVGDWKRYCMQNAWLQRLRGENSIAEFVTSAEQVLTLLGLDRVA